MTRVPRAALFWFVTLLTIPLVRAVDDTWNYSVQADSVIELAPPKITLRWTQDTAGTPASYTVYRKAPSATSWGVGTTLPGHVTTYADTSVTVGQPYEYRIVKVAGPRLGYGYVQAGIQLPLVEDRGTVILVVDRTHSAALAAELFRLQQDLVGDGWKVLRHDVAPTDSVVSVKQLIKADYDAAPHQVRSVFLFGHVPVPYSGKLNPDNHPDHIGAWPADAYYGDMHGTWTDSSVNYRQTLNPDAADAARLSNFPGDGKFDQCALPGAVELEVGRVDLANLPGRPTRHADATFVSEEALLRQYLNKDHNFRHHRLNVQRRALIGDYFGLRGGEAFSASGYRSFAPLVGPAAITNLNLAPAPTSWVSALASRDYLLAYGCGPGTYRTIDGIGTNGAYRDGNSTDLVRHDIQAVFTLIFGSWLGDWDTEDNLMRSILAAPACSLAAAWSGRPHWFVHPMGTGATIGSTARLAQNNTDLYQNQVNASAHQIHIALMGDPTLRLHPVAPITGLAGTSAPTGTTLTWERSLDDHIVGYHVYRAPLIGATFTRLTSAPATNLTFTDLSSDSASIYMVRAVKLENTPSGSYYNASQGIFWTASDNASRLLALASPSPAKAVAAVTQPRSE